MVLRFEELDIPLKPHTIPGRYTLRPKLRDPTVGVWVASACHPSSDPSATFNIHQKGYREQVWVGGPGEKCIDGGRALQSRYTPPWPWHLTIN
eukprot:gene1013-biopygen9420